MKKNSCLTVLLLFFLVFLASIPAKAGTAAKEPVAVLDVTGNWIIEEDLPRQLLLLSIQGIVNKNGPKMYLLIDKNRHNYQEVQELLDYYKTRHCIPYRKLTGIEDALAMFKKYFKGYIVWDPKVRDTINLAITTAGLTDAVIVTEAQIPMVEKIGLACVEDYRNRFSGKSSVEIYSWAIEKLWPRCSRNLVVAIAVYGRQNIVTAIADYAIFTKAFCYDLATRPDSVADYQLVSKLFSEVKPFSILYGWHSTKDSENDYVTLASKYTHRIEGLESLPNFSFHNQIPVSPGFQFKQKYQRNPNPKVQPKVYISAIQTDGLGFGTWLKPGRGAIPFGWEANMNWVDTAPAMLQYYYEAATPNDYFIGNLGGPGYNYPKPFPRDKLPQSLRLAQDLMNRLDLHTFGIMDYSEGGRFAGNIDLPKPIVDLYYENMPNVLGFFNGYGPANTFDIQQNRPLISYSYYLAASRSEDDAAADLRELARLNPKRPYFLAIHVRESNEVDRVKNIIEKAGPEFQIIPADEMMIMAGKNWNLQSRFLEPIRPNFSGQWMLNNKRSIGSYYEISALKVKLEIEQMGNALTLKTSTDYPQNLRIAQGTIRLVIDGSKVKSPQIWHRKMGYLGVTTDSTLTHAYWDADGKTLCMNSRVDVNTAQGITQITLFSKYTLSSDGRHLIITETRSSRQDGVPETFVFDKFF